MQSFDKKRYDGHPLGHDELIRQRNDINKEQFELINTEIKYLQSIMNEYYIKVGNIRNILLLQEAKQLDLNNIIDMYKQYEYYNPLNINNLDINKEEINIHYHTKKINEYWLNHIKNVTEIYNQHGQYTTTSTTVLNC